MMAHYHRACYYVPALFVLLLALFSPSAVVARRSLRQATTPPAISVRCGAGNIAINNQIGQTFVAPTSDKLDKVSVWMKPSLYYVTTYRLDIFAGEFASKLADATLSLGASDEGTPAQFYDFTFSNVAINLVAGQTYSWMLVRTSSVSGAFAVCTDVIPGRGYWLGAYPEAGNVDYSFELFTSPVPATTTPTPAGPIVSGGLYSIKSALDGKCLIFGGNGNDAHPSRFNWGAGDFCGFPQQNGLSAKDSLIANKQAVWQLENLTGNLYTIKSTVDGKCLIFGGNGNDVHPIRHNWGAGGLHCGFPPLNGMTSKESLLANKQAVWEIDTVANDRFVFKSALDGRCLIFGGNGNAVYPERFNWGAGGEFCGFPAINGMSSMESFLNNKQGVYYLELLA